MAPTRMKKRKSTESEGSLDLQDFPAPPLQQKLPTKSGSSSQTPTARSPKKTLRMGITATQKQALIDNLQLESELGS